MMNKDEAKSNQYGAQTSVETAGSLHHKVGKLEARQDATEDRLNRFERYVVDSVNDLSTKLDTLVTHDNERSAREKASWRIITVLASVGVFAAGIITWGISEYLRHAVDFAPDKDREVIIEQTIEEYEEKRKE